jgi:hypothetical protein
MKAELIHQFKSVGEDGIIEMIVWRVPAPVPPSEHPYKYRLVYIVDSTRLVGRPARSGRGSCQGMKRGTYQGETLNFETPSAFFSRLTSNRWTMLAPCLPWRA